MTFIGGLVIGVALGMVVIAFLAVGAYERGYDAAMSAPWRRAPRPTGAPGPPGIDERCMTRPAKRA